MRDKKVWKLMKAEFGRRVGENDKSLVLQQSQIRGYFSRRAAALKGSAVTSLKCAATPQSVCFCVSAR